MPPHIFHRVRFIPQSELGAGAKASAATAGGSALDALGAEGRTQLTYAAAEGDTSTARWLLEQGAGVDVQSRDGATALIRAAWKGNLAVVELLLGKGADVNQQDRHGATALGMAAGNGF